MSTRTLNILSLGAGVQSTALLLMSCKGVLPKLDAAIFADTQWEPASVYTHLEWLEREARAAGIPVHRVTYRNLREDLTTFRVSASSGNGYTHVPLYVRQPDGKLGMLGRTCTQKYKIGPVDRFIKQQLLGLTPGKILPTEPLCDVWLGITWDEKKRAKPSPFAWKRHVHPFCCSPSPIAGCFLHSDGSPHVWSRSDCVRWLEANYPAHHVPRSACIGCPYRSNAEWRNIRADPISWDDAVAVDAALRSQSGPAMGIDGEPYLHRSAVPLPMANLGDDDGTFWDGVNENDCEGMCGL